jgi:hypothetical protein
MILDFFMIAGLLYAIQEPLRRLLRVISLVPQDPDPPVLIVMRLAEMWRVHPDQIEDVCCRCKHVVGIFPSGQAVINHYDGDVEIVCSHCASPAGYPLAPGAWMEQFRTVSNGC